MNTAVLNRKITHPWRWIAFVMATISIFAFIQIFYLKGNAWAPVKPLENVLWTSDPQYQTFYGPGTPQSLAVARQIKSLKDKGYLTTELLFPDMPIYVAPPIYDSSSRPQDPLIIVNFTLDMAKSLRASHKHPNTP
jgi:hypothetical protein